MRVGCGWNCVENARGRQEENALAFDGVILSETKDPVKLGIENAFYRKRKSRRALPRLPSLSHCHSDPVRGRIQSQCFNAVIPLRGVTLGFSHARMNSVATFSLRVILARASPERSRMGVGITFLHRHLEHRERSSQVMCKPSFSRNYNSFTFLGTNVPSLLPTLSVVYNG